VISNGRNENPKNVITNCYGSINKLTKLELLDAHPTQTISIAFRSVTGQLLGLSLYLNREMEALEIRN
jgi:hypothetical protein